MKRYKFNPFIEALPPALTTSELVEKVRYYPEIKLEGMNRIDRLQACNDVMYYYEPLTRTVDFLEQAFNIIYEGYFIRTPKKIIDHFKRKDKIILTNVFNDIEDHLETISHLLNFTVIGDPGTGKSKCVEKLKLLLPSHIFHKSLNMTQIPLVHFECPPKGSPQQIIEFFFTKVDSLIKTNYKDDAAGMKSSEALDFMRRICIDHFIGCICIDEVHNIKANTDKEIDGVMKFIKTVSNVVKTPMIFIGTSEAEDALFRSLQSAIRMQGIGSFEWTMYEYEDDDWTFFLESLWKIQVLKKPGKMTAEIMESYKNKTGGTIRLASVLHLVAQQLCLKLKLETITPDVLELAEKEKMFATEKIMLALKEDDYDTLKDITDLNPLRSEVYRALNQEKVSSEFKAEFDEIWIEIKKIFPKIIDNLIEETILAIIKQFPTLKRKQKLKKIEEVIQSIVKSKRVKTNKGKLVPTGELVDLLKNYNDSEERYQILQESRFIQSLSEIFTL